MRDTHTHRSKDKKDTLHREVFDACTYKQTRKEDMDTNRRRGRGRRMEHGGGKEKGPEKFMGARQRQQPHHQEREDRGEEGGVRGQLSLLLIKNIF